MHANPAPSTASVYPVRLTIALLLAMMTATAQSTDDLWDVAQGTIVTHSSPLYGSPPRFDAQSAFGFTLPGGLEPSSVVFADGNSPDVVQFLEWRTASPVVVTQIVVHAAGQDASWDYARNYIEVTVRAKSAGSPDYDVVLLSEHRRFPLASSLAVTNVPCLAAQEFRAELLPYPTTVSGAYGRLTGCRVMELDAFGFVLPLPSPSPEVALDTHAGIRVEGTPGRRYVVEYSVSGESGEWLALTNLLLTASPTLTVDPTPAREARRFYRAVEIPFP